MSVLLLPLTCEFSDVPEIYDFKVCLYASIFINHYYVKYYQQYEYYDLNVFYPTERREVKMYSAFLSLSILQEIQCLAVELLYLMSENENMNSSCIATAGDETVIRCAEGLSKCVPGEIMGSSIVKCFFQDKLAQEQKFVIWSIYVPQI